MPGPVDVDGAVSVDGPGVAMTVTATNRLIVCQLRSWRDAWALFRLARASRASLARLAALLTATDLELTVLVHHRSIAQAGPRIAPGWLERLLGLSGLRLVAFRRLKSR